MISAREQLLDGLPLIEGRARIAGAATAILEGGDGPPLILLHGGIECGGVVWGPVVKPLVGSHRLIIPDAFSEYTRERARVPHVKRTMRQLIGRCTQPIDDSVLRRIPITTELIWGREDRFVSLRLAKAASARFGWPLHVINDAGHVPHIERSEAFLAALTTATGNATGRSER